MSDPEPAPTGDQVLAGLVMSRLGDIEVKVDRLSTEGSKPRPTQPPIIEAIESRPLLTTACMLFGGFLLGYLVGRMSHDDLADEAR
jgi:hypothetical protein